MGSDRQPNAPLARSDCAEAARYQTRPVARPGGPLYVCEGEEVPLTVGLLAAGLGPGPSLTVLLGSVGTCFPTLLMSRGILGERATSFYLAFWIAFAIGVGAAYQALVG